MKNKLKGAINCSLIFAALLLGASVSQASLLLEPGVAYHNGTYDAGGLGSGKTSGVGLSTRVAFTFPMLFAGLDLSYMFGTTTPDSGSGYDTTAVALGPVVGVSLPALPLRFWLAYDLLDYATQKVTTPVSHDEISSGTAIKLGAGYTLIPLLSLNLEYAMHTYTKLENKLTSTTADWNPALKVNEFILSATIPLDF